MDKSTTIETNAVEERAESRQRLAKDRKQKDALDRKLRAKQNAPDSV